MENTTRIAPVPPGREQTYFWASDHTVLFLRNVPDQSHYAASLLNCRTQEEQPLQTLNAKLGTAMSARPMRLRCFDTNGKLIEPERTLYLPPACALSPDGNVLLWRRGPLRSRQAWAAATLDGAELAEWSDPVRGNGHPLWLRDSRQWLEVVDQCGSESWRFTHARIHSLDTPGESLAIRLTGTASGLLLGLTQDQRLLTFDPNLRKPVQEVTCFLMGLGPRVAVTEELRIPLPALTQTQEAELSPQGDRLAWTLCNVPDREPMTFWISDLKGDGMRQVGSVPVLETRWGPDLKRRGSEYPSQLRWTPDGNRLSFLYDSGLWTVDV